MLCYLTILSKFQAAKAAQRQIRDGDFQAGVSPCASGKMLSEVLLSRPAEFCMGTSYSVNQFEGSLKFEMEILQHPVAVCSFQVQRAAGQKAAEQVQEVSRSARPDQDTTHLDAY